MDVHRFEEATAMVDHSRDSLGEHDEPDGGWVSSPQLIDTELLTIVLCRFTGEQLADVDDDCVARANRLHPDQACASVYIQADAISQTIDLVGVTEELRVPFGGGPSAAEKVVQVRR